MTTMMTTKPMTGTTTMMTAGVAGVVAVAGVDPG